MSVAAPILAGVSGFLGGVLYFHTLWRSTRRYVAAHGMARQLAIHAGLRLAAIISVVGVSFALGAGALEIGAALFGFLLARQAATGRARGQRGKDRISIAREGQQRAH
ncbi:MAG: ATP synthase subunit I [Amphiplicatus sp.]